jgi:hypothetical protein
MAAAVHQGDMIREQPPSCQIQGRGKIAGIGAQVGAQGGAVLVIGRFHHEEREEREGHEGFGRSVGYGFQKPKERPSISFPEYATCCFAGQGKRT